MMRGKTVIITGANSGIGKATAVELLKLQARVIMACRDQQRAEEAAQEIQMEAGPDHGEVMIKSLDLASLKSVRRFCEEIIKEEPRIDVLINNAGIYQCPFTQTEDGFEMQFGVNHLGHFLLTSLLLDLLKKSAPSRIVVVSSKLYKHGEIDFDDLNSTQRYNKAFAYSRSKLANLLFTLELAKRLQETGVTINALTPGIVRTNLGRHVSVPLLVKPLFSLASWMFFKSPHEGAQTSLYLASSPDVEGVQGKCFANCREEELLPKATDVEVARKLWDISEIMIKRNYTTRTGGAGQLQKKKATLVLWSQFIFWIYCCFLFPKGLYCVVNALSVFSETKALLAKSGGGVFVWGVGSVFVGNSNSPSCFSKLACVFVLFMNL